jgi:pyruvate formate lyase activating enzyme
VERSLDELTARRTELAQGDPDGSLHCVACAHRCRIPEGGRGICRLRRRDGAALLVPWGYVAGVAADPIEKKPFYHVLPGSHALSFGMLGCNLHCSFCQNWESSQVGRDPSSGGTTQRLAASDLVALALRHRCRVITSTYNEPLITAEWAHDVFTLARAGGLRTSFVSNGYATPEVVDFLAPVLDAMKVDLKAFRESTYASLGGRLAPVLETIRELHARRVWVEVVTLLVPGLNDSPAELADIAGFLASVDPEIPWHITAFHPNYRMDDRTSTSAEMLIEAASVGRREGLRFVYAGNLPGHTGNLENTYCPACGTALVWRHGFTVQENGIVSGSCPACRTAIPGIWA